MRLASMSTPLLVLDRNIYFEAPGSCSKFSLVADLLLVVGVFFCFVFLGGLGCNTDRSCQSGASSLFILKSAEKMKQAARPRERPRKNKSGLVKIKTAFNKIECLVSNNIVEDNHSSITKN